MEKILVVGGGGREHAVIKSLIAEDRELFCASGNAGIAKDANCVDIKATDIEGIKNFCISNKIDFCVVTPDDPLVMGMVDELEKSNIKCFGPNKDAAILEGSKIFSKQLMKKYNIPTAKYETFDNAETAISYIKKENTYPTVIKADGLALGKGVIIAENQQQAIDGVNSIMQDKIFGASGNSIVIEEFLQGPEVSVLAFCDGKTVKPLISAMDHKRALDGNKGLNTGGMGTIAPNPYYTKSIADRCMNEIFIPTMEAMNKENRTFKGVIFFGLMITKDGPKVIEYNCRFGDPETQVVLPLLQSDLLGIFKAVREQRLSETEVLLSDKACACVIMASGGYPTKYQSGYEICGLENSDGIIYHAGTKLVDGKIVTAGGRVLGVTAMGDNLDDALNKAYQYVEKISFKDAYYRKDIGRAN